MMPHLQAMTTMIARRDWFNSLSHIEQIKFVASGLPYPCDSEVTALCLGGGCIRPEDSGWLRVLHNADLVRHFDHIFASSKGAIEAACLGDVEEGRNIWAAIGSSRKNGCKFTRLGKSAVCNLMHIAAYDIVSRARERPKFGPFLRRHNRFRLARRILHLKAPIDMSYLHNALIRHTNDGYRNLRTRIHVLATRLEDGVQVQFDIQNMSPKKARLAIMASCRLLGVGGAPVEIDGKLYADADYSGHALRAAALRGSTQIVMHSNRHPSRAAEFEDWKTTKVLLYFLKRYSLNAWQAYWGRVGQTKAIMLEAKDQGKITGLGRHASHVSLAYPDLGQEVTFPLETNRAQLDAGDRRGQLRAERAVAAAEAAWDKIKPPTAPARVRRMAPTRPSRVPLAERGRQVVGWAVNLMPWRAHGTVPAAPH